MRDGSADICSAHFTVLEVNWFWSDGRLQPITFSAERMICCSLPLSLAVAAAHRWWWRKWEWTQWWQCWTKPSLFLAGQTYQPAAGSTPSVMPSWWGRWYSPPTWGSVWWWSAGSRSTTVSTLELILVKGMCGGGLVLRFTSVVSVFLAALYQFSWVCRNFIYSHMQLVHTIGYFLKFSLWSNIGDTCCFGAVLTWQ